jgi:hypothetical protein
VSAGSLAGPSTDEALVDRLVEELVEPGSGADKGAVRLKRASDGAGRGAVAFFGGTTSEVPVAGMKEKEVTLKVTGAPFQGPALKFCQALRCRRSKPVGLGMMLLSIGHQDVA